MKITCTNNKCEENLFLAHVYVVEQWYLDGEGNHLDNRGISDVVEGPVTDDATCVCGSPATVN